MLVSASCWSGRVLERREGKGKFVSARRRNQRPGQARSPELRLRALGHRKEEFPFRVIGVIRGPNPLKEEE